MKTALMPRGDRFVCQSCGEECTESERIKQNGWSLIKEDIETCYVCPQCGNDDLREE